ncbi:MAG: hypothetical protein R2867_24640 [Caldilineaceae bacterium]
MVALSSPYTIGLFLLPVIVTGAFYLLVWQRHALWRCALYAGTVDSAQRFVHPALLSVILGNPEIGRDQSDAGPIGVAISADLLSWVLPSGFHPLWGRYTAATSMITSQRQLMETTVYPGATSPAGPARLRFVERCHQRASADPGGSCQCAAGIGTGTARQRHHLFAGMPSNGF